jgi:2-polyprenyl-3-methyl-5-hydroxy-6-metoxy-1,4-benzoquinol methylase
MSKKACPICGSDFINIFLRRPKVPVHQNLLIKDQESATNVTYGDLELAVCQECSFIFNRNFEPAKLSYGLDYDNSQTCSPLFKQYLESLAHDLVFEKSLQNSRIVEVGCGNGFFLRKLVAAGAGNVGYGFDPSYCGPRSEFEGRLKFESSYYGPGCPGVPADVVICRHVIEHIADPLNLLRIIKDNLNNSRARIFFETPDVEWILRHRAFWDFFYEHASYFSRHSLTTAFQAAGFEVKTIKPVFAEQYLWLEATRPITAPEVTKSPGSLPQLAQEFALVDRDLRRAWTSKIQSLAEKGGIALWGAAAKGTTFANLIDPHRQWITGLVDINPNKQGRYIAGSGHPIINYNEIPKYNIKSIILMNPNYRDENLALLREIGLDIGLIDLTWSNCGDYENNN